MLNAQLYMYDKEKNARVVYYGMLDSVRATIGLQCKFSDKTSAVYIHCSLYLVYMSQLYQLMLDKFQCFTVATAWL